jgi:hypothetical protein
MLVSGSDERSPPRNDFESQLTVLINLFPKHSVDELKRLLNEFGNCSFKVIELLAATAKRPSSPSSTGGQVPSSSQSDLELLAEFDAQLVE